MVLPSKGILFYLRILLFAVYLINGILAIPRNSVVYDEMEHWSYGKRILKGQPQKVYTYDDATDMPVSALNAIPRAAEQLATPGLLKTDGGFSDIMHGRYVTLLVCLLIGIFIYRWSKELFGEKGGIFSLFLFVFCPNLNAHATLLTTDAYSALFTLSSFYYFWKFVKQSGNKNFILFSISFGAAQIVKYSLLHLLPIFALLSLLILLRRKTIFKGWKIKIIRVVVFCAIVLTIMNAAYLFMGSGQKLADYDFKSRTFQSLQSLPVVSSLPVPLPVPYVEGLDVTFHMTELGAGHPLVSGRNYLMGEFRTGKGFWNYYLVIILYKTPLSYLAAFVLWLVLLFKAGKRTKDYSAEMIAGFGVVYYLVYFSLFSNIQAGIRHIILIYPLLYVLMGRIALVQWKRNYKLVAAAVYVLYTICSFYFFYPNLISYSNELITDKKKAYEVMSDSNIDYGQGNFAIAKYLQRNSDVKIADTIPQAGRIVIGVNDYLDIYGTGKFGWLRNFEPVRHIDHCYLEFNVTETGLKEKRN